MECELYDVMVRADVAILTSLDFRTVVDEREGDQP